MPPQGFSTVVTTAGTPQRLTASPNPALATVSGALGGSLSPRGCFISLQAPHTNTAGKYIYVGGPTMNVAAETGIWWEILTGSAPVKIFLTDGETDLADYYIDTDAGTNGTEKLFVATIG